MRAATWSQEFDLIDTIDGTLELLESKGFGEIDRKVVLRNLSTAAGGDFTVSSIDALRNFTAAQLNAAASQVEDAYKRSVDFLATEMRIPSVRVIPYANQLVVLSEVFRQIPSPDAGQYQQLCCWFWRSCLSSYFSGWNTGNMVSDQKAVEEFANGASTALAILNDKPRPDIWIRRQFRANGAHAKILAIVLSYQEPIDLLTGQLVDVGAALAWTNAKEFHHFFPRDFLKNRGVPSKRINALANFVMLTSVSNKKISNRAPSDYLRDVEAAAGDNLERWLQSNLVTMEAFEAAKRDDYDAFLQIRADAIYARTNQLADWV